MHSIDAAYCHTRGGVVRLCVCVCVRVYVTGMNPAKTAESIEMPFGMWTWVGPRNHVLNGRSGSFQGKGNFGRCAKPCMPAVGIFNKMMRPFIELLRSLVTFQFFTHNSRNSRLCYVKERVTGDLQLAVLSTCIAIF